MKKHTTKHVGATASRNTTSARTSERLLEQQICQNDALTSYHKKQIIRAIKKGLRSYVEKDMAMLQHHQISAEQLMNHINKKLIEKEIKDDELYISSMDDFLDRF